MEKDLLNDKEYILHNINKLSREELIQFIYYLCQLDIQDNCEQL